MKPEILSFFTGGGFLDIGFEQAGFKILWTNEYNKTFATLYSHGLTSLKRKNVTISNENSIIDIADKQIIQEAFHGKRPDFFGMIGGPPCPDFSQGGKHAGGEGKNGQLTKIFVEKICDIKPDFFLIENVSGLYKYKKHREFLYQQLTTLRNARYAIDYRILNALDFGVPQTRERLFIVGFKSKYIVNGTKKLLPEMESGWFLWPKEKYPNAVQAFTWPKKHKFGLTPAPSSEIPSVLTVEYAFTNPTNATELSNGTEFFQPHSQKFKTIMEGDDSGFSFKRLHRYRYSPTAWYGHQEVHLHPWEPRRLSVREAMRLQTVPDEYVMPAEINLSAKFQLICNGVPCLLAEQVAKSLLKFIKTIW